jgi:acylglycerol lipase
MATASACCDKLCRRRWPLPVDRARARVFICHGTHEHSGRYAELAMKLNSSDIEAFALDYHGHGRREGARGDFGEIDDAIDETVELVVSESQRNPSLPIVVFGHSLGSMIAFLTAHRLSLSSTLPTPTAVVLSGFAMDSVSPPFGIKALTPVLRALPGVILRITTVLASVQPQGPACPLPPASELMDDEERAKQALADPLQYQGWIQNRTACALLEGRKRCKALLGEWGRDFPFLMLHGGADDLCPRTACDALIAASPQADKELKVYDGSAHEVLNGKPATRDRALRDIVHWLDPRIRRTPQSRL